MFRDHFSGHAGAYARCRPGYPQALFDWLSSRCSEHALAWDAGTGNGQVARGLATHFNAVHASDASAEQIEHAERTTGVRFAVEPAERPRLADASVDLVTVGQALHWFDVAAFHTAVRRVLKPGGLYAAWCYGLSRVGPAVDAVVDRLYVEIVGPYWPPERRYIETGYRDLPFPFERVPAPTFEMTVSMTLEAFTEYLGTWSACRRYAADRGADPLDRVRAELARAWGSSDGKATVTWPVTLLAGR